jgi:hypothetical protein
MQVLQAMGYAVPPVSFIGGNLLELVSLFYKSLVSDASDKYARVLVLAPVWPKDFKKLLNFSKIVQSPSTKIPKYLQRSLV